LRGTEEIQKYTGALGENEIKPAQEGQASLLYKAFTRLKKRCAI